MYGIGTDLFVSSTAAESSSGEVLIALRSERLQKYLKLMEDNQYTGVFMLDLQPLP